MVEHPLNSQRTDNNYQRTSELLNSVKYNYGKLTESHSFCSFQKNSNRLAICTEKSLIIVNLNLNWPKTLDSVAPAKLRKNYDKITAKKAPLPTEFTKSSFHIDAWIQDLLENKNNLLSINLISSTGKSKAVEDVYRDFFKIEENFKRKPFHRQIRDLVDSNTSGNNSISMSAITETVELSTIDAHLKIVESNIDQYLRHKQLIEQHNIYDANLYDYLSFLNPINNQNQQIASNTANTPNSNLPLNYFNYGFKYCKWNKNSSLQLICAINACNQLFVFNCTNLNKIISPIDQQQSDLDGKDLKDPKTYNRIFDSKSRSTVINLTELWLYKYRQSVLMSSEKPKTVNDYFQRVLQLMPIHLTWSETFPTSNQKTGELLFVTLKSNEITCYLITENDDNLLELELVYILPMPELAENTNTDDDEACAPNLLDFISTDIQQNSSRISCTEFWNKDPKYGLLAVGLQNGAIFLTCLDLQNLNFDKDNYSPRYYKLKGVLNTGAIESIKIYKIVQNMNDLKLLVVAKRESSLVFSIVDYNSETNLFRQDEWNFTQFYNDCETQTADSHTNFLTKNHYKLIKIKLINKKIADMNKFVFEFWLIFENTYIKNLNVRISLNKSKNFLVTDEFYLEEPQLINDSVQLKFDTGKKEYGIHAQFKMTRGLFFSNDDSLIFQINDYSKLELLERKITQLEINLYRVKPQEELIVSLLPTSAEMIERANQGSLDLKKFYFKGITELTDIIWSFKRNLYLNMDFFDINVFQLVHANIKYVNTLIDIFEQVIDDSGFNIYVKRLRLLILYLANYFEMVTSFEYLNQPIARSNEDEMDQDNDESMQDDSELAEADVSRNEPSSSENNTECSIIKSAPYYRSIFKEYTLCLFRSHALKLVYHANKVGFKDLTNKERLILLLIGDFSIKKNFFADNNHKKILEWLEENFINIDSASKITDKFNSPVSLISLCNQIKCDLCGKSLRIDLSKELNSIECEMGHVMSRCQKSLLPLNSLNYKSCTKCNSTWNILDPIDYPNLDQLYSAQNICIFCS